MQFCVPEVLDNITYIKFHGALKDPRDIQPMIDAWLAGYATQKDFSLIFDMMDAKVGWEIAELQALFKLRIFMKNVSRQCEDWSKLKTSLIITNSAVVEKMLSFLFLIQKPLSDVYLYNSMVQLKQIWTCRR